MNRFEMARALVDEAGGLVGRSDLAEAWNVTLGRVHQLARDPSFPKPVGYIGISPAWFANEVNVWREERIRARAGRS